MKDARTFWYKRNGIPADGGASEKVAKAPFGPITLYVPNFSARMGSLERHDLHHILLNAPTSVAGEAIVGAFETAAGCGSFWVSWFLEPQNIIFGLVLCPRDTYRTFLLGRRSKSLFHGPFQSGWIEMSVGELRKKILASETPKAKPLDIFSFLFWTAVGFCELMISFAVLALRFACLFFLIRMII